MSVGIKICGLTRPEDARAAASAGADLVGFVFFPASRRCLPPSATEWVRSVMGALKVGVFRDQAPSFVEALRDVGALDMVQLHGAESPDACARLGGRERVIKAISVDGPVDWGLAQEYAAVARILFDTASPTGGGTGRPFDWSRLSDRPDALEFWLAGGLRPDNVGPAVTALRPAGVDVASGVESAVGVKDPARMVAFVAAARAAAREISR